MSVFYFAYGSNMDKERMKKREVEYASRELAILKNHKLIFNKKASGGDFAYANIEKDENDNVEGILYEVTNQGIAKLDRFEGYPSNYSRSNIAVICKGQVVSAIVYIANEDKVRDKLLPKKDYLNHILAGKDLLSEEYFERLTKVQTLD